MEELREAPVSGHIFREKRQSGDRCMAKWRDAGGQHQRVIGKAWIGRGRPPEGHLTKRGAQEVLDTILADARRGRLVARRPGATVTFADAAEEWLRYLEHERGRRASTLRNYRLSLRNHILPALGPLPLTAVTVPRIDALRTYLIRQRGPRRVDGQPASGPGARQVVGGGGASRLPTWRIRGQNESRVLRASGQRHRSPCRQKH